MDIVTALAADGIVCVVGAGGKKTTMYTLADRLDRAVVTATVRIPIFDEYVARVAVTDDPVETVRTTEAWPIGVVPEREREDRYLGYDPSVIDELAGLDEPDAVLVKADGARMRRLKAPDDREPQLPISADTVIPIASAHVVGQPLHDDRVHRVDRVAEITGLSPGETITAADVAAVLASDRGGRKDIPEDATVIPLVNMIDDATLETVGRDIAEAIHARTTVPRVVLARMTAEHPLVAVVE
ncbi:MAG: selenium cofactor biosynthesis protein YqeC [Halobacteriales archaeon]|nr:selenium cofactor biosynthesis protein YqeC [Halobacteriales archaeon]